MVPKFKWPWPRCLLAEMRNCSKHIKIITSTGIKGKRAHHIGIFTYKEHVVSVIRSRFQPQNFADIFSDEDVKNDEAVPKAVDLCWLPP
jgi:hypothetical protein